MTAPRFSGVTVWINGIIEETSTMSQMMKDMGFGPDGKFHSMMDDYPGITAAAKALQDISIPFAKDNEVNHRPAAWQQAVCTP